jgi:hypothetical protein
MDQGKKSRIATEVIANFCTDNTKPALKKSIDNPLRYSQYLLPPFI